MKQTNDPSANVKTEDELPKTVVSTENEPAKEVNGRAGLEPTRYGDWEKNGRCIDF
jgi:hypothetical protein